MHAKEKNQGECVCLSEVGTAVFSQDVLRNKKILLYSTGNYIQYPVIETSLVVQLLGFCTSNAGATGWIPGHGMKISHASQHRQKKKDKIK